MSHQASFLPKVQSRLQLCDLRMKKTKPFEIEGTESGATTTTTLDGIDIECKMYLPLLVESICSKNTFAVLLMAS